MSAIAPASVEHELRVDVGGVHVRVSAAVEPVLREVESRLAHVRRATVFDDAALDIVYDTTLPPHEPPTDAREVYASAAAAVTYSPSEDALYARHDEGPTLRCAVASGSAEIACGPSPEEHLWVLTRPLLTLALMELMRPLDRYPLHAACVAAGDDGVLVCGPSGSGKSTIALALVREGFEFLGDDLAFVLPDGDGVAVAGFADEVGVARGTAGVVDDRDDRFRVAATDTWPKARAPIDALVPGAAVATACRPRLVVVLSDAGAAEEVSADAAILELLPTMLLTDPSRCTDHLRVLSTLVSTTRCVRIPPRSPLADVVALAAGTERRP